MRVESRGTPRVEQNTALEKDEGGVTHAEKAALWYPRLPQKGKWSSPRMIFVLIGLYCTLAAALCGVLMASAYHSNHLR